MATLREQLGSPNKRASVVDDACRVLDQEVADKSGLGGLAVKAAYKVVQSIKPGFVREVVEALLDDFLDALEPLYREAIDKGQRPSSVLDANRDRAADALLGITDDRARKAKRAAIKSAYDRLRPSAKKHVEAAVPRLGQMLDRHAA
jgi:hypothetical protein